MKRFTGKSTLVLMTIMLVLLGATLIVAHTVRESSRAQSSKQFALESGYLSDRVQARFNTYEQVLRGGVGLFKGSDQVSRTEWEEYVSELSLGDYFPGILGVGYSVWVGDAAALARHESAVRAEGFPDFSVVPVEPAREDYTSIVYLAPLNERNKRAIGYDMYSESNRRAAMERARDTGRPALSGKVELLQETQTRKQAGFLLYMPVYDNGASPTSIKDRRDSLRGFVYSPFRATDLMQGILKKDISRIAFQVFDVSPSSNDSILYDGYAALGLDRAARQPQFTNTELLNIAGRQWAIEFSSTPWFESNNRSDAAVAVLIIGTLISLLIGAIAWMLMSARRRVRDRTLELRRIECVNDQLQEATRVAERANLAKSSFLAAMSHEIRTPMNGVVGMVEVMLNEDPEPHQAASLNVVMDSATSLLGCIDDILDFSKIEAGHLELEETEAVLGDIVEGVVSSMVPHALGRNVSVHSFIDPGLPASVTVDHVRLRQILTNLIGNAVKFSGSAEGCDGIVQVRVYRQGDDAGRIRFDVVDNGIGIEAGAVDMIFEDFVQAESSTTRRFGGSGLGLAISKRLVSTMQGDISVKSQPGVGSTFSVSLPLPSATTGQTHTFEDITGVRCVLIPDEQLCTDTLQRYLEASGAVVSILDGDNAASGADASMPASAVRIGMESANERAGEEPGNIRRVQLTRGNRGMASGQVFKRDATTSGPASRPDETCIRLQLEGLRRHDLIAAVAVASGKVSPRQLRTKSCTLEKTAMVPLSVDAARAAGSLILVAEDDAINQKVLNKQLSLLGLTAEYADNGQVALSLWRTGEYCLLITDLHMPIIDGYQLVEIIRREESAEHRLPIIALTATAVRDETTRALESGVDRYLTKPIRLNALKAAIDKLSQQFGLPWVEHATSSAVSTPECKPTVKVINDPVFDPAVLSTLVGRDRDIEAELQGQFVETLDELGGQLHRAIANNDKDGVAPLAHRLISTSRSIGAMKLGAECFLLQTACNDDSHALTIDDAGRFSETLADTRTAVVAAMGKG